MVNISIFASGEGSNAERIHEYFRSSEEIRIVGIICNRAQAGIYARAKRLGIEIRHIERKALLEGLDAIDQLRKWETDLIVLAGYMCPITAPYLEAYPGRIINIHPSLLPRYGGKGMYGDHVHKAVLEAQEPISGISIHLVDEQYDHGRTLCQVSCPVIDGDSPHSLAERIHRMEHRYYPITIEQYIEELKLAPQNS